MNQALNTRTYSSGAAHRSKGWQDQLQEIGAILKPLGDENDELGYGNETHRDEVVVKPFETSPLIGFEVQSALCSEEEVESDVSNESHIAITTGLSPIGIGIGVVDSQPRVTSSVENVDEASMSSNREDQFSNDENRSNFKKVRDYEERTDAHNDHEDDQEDDEAKKARLAKEARVKKGFMWSVLSVSTVVLVGAGLAVVQGLYGGHKSNIMNL